MWWNCGGRIEVVSGGWIRLVMWQNCGGKIDVVSGLVSGGGLG